MWTLFKTRLGALRAGCYRYCTIKNKKKPDPPAQKSACDWALGCAWTLDCASDCLSMLIKLRSDHSFHSIREGMLSGLSCLRSTSLLRNSCPMVLTSVFSYFFERLDTVSVDFSPAFLVCRRYPELISSLNRMFLFSYYWHFIQLLSWKPSWSCRLSIFFIFRIHTSGFV